MVLIGASIYVIVLIVIGFFASRKVKSGSDFIVAGRKLPLVLVTFTIFASWFGPGTCIGAAGKAFEKGFLGVISTPFGSAICLIVAGFFFIRFLRRMKLLTVPDFYKRRYSEFLGLLSSIIMIPAYIGWTGSTLVAFGFILHTVTGIDSNLCILIGTVVVLTYTVAGGMWAASMTDFVQAIILIGGLIVIIPFALSDIGGIDALIEKVPKSHFAILPLQNTLADWMWYIEAILIIAVGSVPAQDLLQKTFSAKSERVAQWGTYLAAIIYILIAMIPVLLGIIGSIAIPDIANPEYILPTLGLKYLSPALTVLFMGALIAALLSSASGGMMAASSIFTTNVLPKIKANMGSKQELKAVRISIPIFGFMGLMVALYFQNVFDLMVSSFGIIFVGLFVPLAAGIYWKKANTPAAFACMITGVVGWIILANVQDKYPGDLIAFFISMIVFVVVAQLTYKKTPPVQLFDESGELIPYSGRLGVLNLFKKDR